MEFCWRWLYVILIVLTFLTERGCCVGAKCWACNAGDETEDCMTPAQTYIPEVAVTDSFCSDLRNSDVLVTDLCKKFPAGWKVVCERTNPVKQEIICSSRNCLSQHHQTGAGGDAILPNFVFIVGVGLVALWIVFTSSERIHL